MSVKMGPIIETGHHLKHFVASINTDALLTFGADGTVILRGPTAPEKYGEEFYSLLPDVLYKRTFSYNIPFVYNKYTYY